MICPNCDGEGWIYGEGEYGSETHRTCPKCKGHGVVRLSVPAECGPGCEKDYDPETNTACHCQNCGEFQGSEPGGYCPMCFDVE